MYEKNGRKVPDGNPSLFSILHVCAKFHQSRMNNEDFSIWVYGPLFIRQQAKFCSGMSVLPTLFYLYRFVLFDRFHPNNYKKHYAKTIT